MSVDPAALERLNTLPQAQARDELRRCCAASRWVEAMVEARPFATRDELHGAALSIASSLQREDWLEAFAAHPRIGDREVLRTKLGWEGDEQSGVSGADEQLLDELAAGNLAYERRFGFVFLICATGKPAGEMHTALQQRLRNDPEHEWRAAADEQRQITALRLDKLLAALAPAPSPAPDSAHGG